MTTVYFVMHDDTAPDWDTLYEAARRFVGVVEADGIQRYEVRRSRSVPPTYVYIVTDEKQADEMSAPLLGSGGFGPVRQE